MDQYIRNLGIAGSNPAGDAKLFFLKKFTIFQSLAVPQKGLFGKISKILCYNLCDS